MDPATTADRFDEPAGDFEWGPDRGCWHRVRHALPYIAVAVGSAAFAIGLALLEVSLLEVSLL